MNFFLLRGLIREKAHWGSFILELENAFPGNRVHTLEIPGVGADHGQTSPDNFDEMIAFMRDPLTEHFSGKEENLLLAMSLGGMMARRWMELHPGDFQRVVLANTSFKGLNPLHHRLRPSSMLRFIRIFFTPGMEARERAIVRMVSNDPTNHEEIVREWMEIQKKRPVSRKSFLNQIKAALTFQPSLVRPGARLLILAGRGDRLCDPRSSEEIHRAWGGTLVMHPSAGHDLPLDDSVWVIKQILDWLRQESL
jgi:pimeloyl-ACP methyl ester carboxylesterase